jgi:hypothetical protein
MLGTEERGGGGGFEVGPWIFGPGAVMERGSGGLMSGEGESRRLCKVGSGAPKKC